MTAPDPFEAPPSLLSQKRAAAVRWVLIVGFAVLAAVGIAIGIGFSPGGAEPARAGPARFHCPMHPQITSDAPGTCPICAMDLVPIPMSEGRPLGPTGVTGRTEVTIDPTRIRQIGVVSVEVTRRSITTEVVAPARVSLDAGRVSVVDTRLPGWLTKLRARTTGTRVRRGEALATLTSTDLYEAESQLVAARLSGAALGASGGSAGTTIMTQARARLAAFGVPRAEIERVASGGAAGTRLTLRAPRDGTVVAVGATEGAFVSPGTTILTIADLSQVWVLADLAEADAPLVSIGDSAQITSTATPDAAAMTGRVELFEPLVDPQTRTRRARIVLSADASGAATLVPGATATARFTSRARSALLVPRDAVLTSGTESHTFVDLGAGRFAPRPVRVGEPRDGMIEVLEGLAEGERVASVAAFMIDAESQLRATGAR